MILETLRPRLQLLVMMFMLLKFLLDLKVMDPNLQLLGVGLILLKSLLHQEILNQDLLLPLVPNPNGSMNLFPGSHLLPGREPRLFDLFHRHRLEMPLLMMLCLFRILFLTLMTMRDLMTVIWKCFPDVLLLLLRKFKLYQVLHIAWLLLLMFLLKDCLLDYLQTIQASQQEVIQTILLQTTVTSSPIL